MGREQSYVLPLLRGDGGHIRDGLQCNGSGIRNSQIWNGYRSYGSDEARGDHEEHHSGGHGGASPSTGWLLPSPSQASSRLLVWVQNTHFTRASCTWEPGFQLVSLVWRQATPSALSVMLASVAPHSSPGSSSA